MAWLRIGGSLTGVAVCAAAFAMLWPHANRAGHMLAAQDDPAELSEMQVNSVVRNDPGAIERQIEAALAANDAISPAALWMSPPRIALHFRMHCWDG